MKKIIILICLLFFNSNSFAKIVVSGTICGMKISGASNFDAYMEPTKYKFPLKNYKVGSFFICHLKYANSTPVSQRQFDLNKYNLITAEGTLDLMSYDKKSGFFKYKLMIEVLGIRNRGLQSLIEAHNIKGNVFFATEKNYLPIEGRFHYVDNKVVVTNTLVKGEDFYQFEPDYDVYPKITHHMTLTRLKDFPVKVEFEMDDSRFAH